MIDCEYIYYGKPPSGVTVLYRIDNTDSSEIWVAEGSQKRLLGTYGYQINYFPNRVARTHLGGVFRGGQGLPDDAFEVDILSPSDTSNTSPFTGSRIQGTNQSYVWTLDNERIQIDFTWNNSLNTDAFVRYAIPSGDYRADAEAVASVTELQNQIFGNVRAIVDLNGLRVYDVRDNTSGSPQILADNQYATQRSLALSPIETGDITLANDNFTGQAGSATFYEVRLEATLISLDFRFRPVSYLSKIGSTRYVGVEYFDDQGRFATDYFAIANNLAFTKTTALYPAIPTPATADPGRFWITKDKAGLGQSFTLADGSTPSPGLNIVNDRLVSIFAYANTAQYNIPVGQTFPLNRTYDGVTTQIQVPGLGLEPSKVLGVADLV